MLICLILLFFGLHNAIVCEYHHEHQIMELGLL